MGMILDTSALVSLERGGEDFITELAKFSDEKVALPAIVWAEMLAGVRLAKNVGVAARRRARLEQLRIHLPIIDFDADIAEYYANIFAECVKKGRKIPQNDMMIAATAKYLRYSVLVGKNGEEHFRQVKKLKIVSI